MQRVFLVGCPRSGTTVLQAALAAHSRITSFPETSFFRQAVRQPQRRFGYNRSLDQMFGGDRSLPRQLEWRFRYLTEELKPSFIAHPAVNARVSDFLAGLERTDLAPLFPAWSPLLKPKVRGFVRILDRLAIERGKSHWIEKTPAHVLYLDVIERYVPGPKVIHIIRHGPDVIASLADAKTKFEAFRKKDKDRPVDQTVGIDTLVTLWNRCYEQSMAYRHLANHLVLSYEEFLRDPASLLREACGFLKLEFEDRMLLDRGVDLRTIAASGPAKRSVAEGIRAPEDKFSKLFNPAERAYILENLTARTRP